MVDAVPPPWTLATDSLILLASMAVWLLLGWAFVIHFLFRNHEIRHTLVQVFFAGTFCLGRPGGEGIEGRDSRIGNHPTLLGGRLAREPLLCGRLTIARS